VAQSVQITGTGQLIELSRRLKAAGGPRLKQNFARRIRHAAEPLKNDLQQTIRSLPIRSEGRKAGKRGGRSPTSRPLRVTVARGVRISVRTSGNPGARVWFDKDLVPPDLRNMASAMNSANGRIRHPVFGNRKRWANQWTTPMWWDKTVASHRDRMTREVARVVDDVRNQLS
jgi:hypothetical protein